MLITENDYHGLIQVQWETRKNHIKDPHRRSHEWQIKLDIAMGKLARTINDNLVDHSLLQNIIVIADILRSWYWCITDDETPFLEIIKKERELQDAKWGYQIHTRFKWYLIAAEEAGEIPEAFKKDNMYEEIQKEIVQLSAVFQAWVTSHDWIEPEHEPLIVQCQRSDCFPLKFETKPGDPIICPKCKTKYDSRGNIIPQLNL